MNEEWGYLLFNNGFVQLSAQVHSVICQDLLDKLSNYLQFILQGLRVWVPISSSLESKEFTLDRLPVNCSTTYRYIGQTTTHT